MEQKKSISHIVAGLLIAGILIIYSMAMSFAGGKASGGASGGIITWLIIILGLVFFINLYGKSKDNYVSFGNLFAYGFKTTSVMLLVFVLFLVVLAFIMPEMKKEGLDAARQQLEKDGKMSDREIEDGLSIMNKYFWVIMIGGSVLAFVIVGCIGSLIGAAITKKRPHNPLDQLSV